MEPIIFQKALSRVGPTTKREWDARGQGFNDGFLQGKIAGKQEIRLELLTLFGLDDIIKKRIEDSLKNLE